MAASLPLLLFLCASVLSFHPSPASPSPLCPRSELASVVDDLRPQLCPRWIERSSPLEVSGDVVDKELARVHRRDYYSILFYASWCPFSRNIQSTFETLTSMFPQIRHLVVEESSAMPSTFSRYGIHSFPSILVVNGTARVRYHGSKDLNSLVHFYKEITGHDPVAYLTVEQPSSSGNTRTLLPWDIPLREFIRSEPYLAFAILFICVKACAYVFPEIISRLKAFWAVYALHLNLGIFGEWSQLLERVLHVIDAKRLWSKLNLCNKARNFQKGAKNARVWASSLASVSLGESSSSRSIS